MTDDELEIPLIEPVAKGMSRPRWSVMIPTYNAEKTIAETLRSVLAQVRKHSMQICVVDNLSTDKTLSVVERAVADCGMRGLVEIRKNPSNLGMVGNFNSCLRHSRGELIHLLHADDYVQPGFYAAMYAAMQEHPEAEVGAARVVTIDYQGEIEYITNRLARNGDLTVHDVAYENQLYPPGVVVRRSGYERVGGYSNVISYLPDWEMWTRLLEQRPGVFVNELLACYRQTPGNATDYFSRTAGDVRDMMRFGHVLRRRVPGFSREHWRTRIRRHAEWGMSKWRAAGDETAYRANHEIWLQLASRREQVSFRIEQAKKLAAKWSKHPAAAPVRSVAKALLATKELGKKLERSVRMFVRRGRKKDANKGLAGKNAATRRAA